MFEAIEYYQSLAEKFDSRILTVPGIIVVILGLCIWLAGLRWRKVLGAIAGGGIFAAAVVCIGSFDVNIVLAVILIGIAVGALIEKITLGIFGTAAAAVIVLVITSANLTAKQYSDTSISQEDLLSQHYCPRWPEYEDNDAVINLPQAAEITRKMAWYFTARAIDNIKSSPVSVFAATVIMVAVAGFVAVLVPRMFIAVTASSLGSVIIFAGMVMLLFYKVSKPVNYIAEKSHFYVMALTIMIAFGAMVQLVLSPSACDKASSDKPANEKKGDKK
jgi:hypothetical protein